MKKMMLLTDWLVRSEELFWEKDKHMAVLHKEEGWMPTQLPCDIHMPLIENGVIDDPLIGDNCYKCEWVEKKSWWFKKSFHLESTDGYIAAELVMESLDVHADVFLNGIYLGHQASAFYPFKTEVKKWLKEGENTLLVRMTTGLEHVSDKDLARVIKNISTEANDGRGDRGDIRRAGVRKPQFAFGWDWGPRVATCGIMKDVHIAFLGEAVIRRADVVTKCICGGKAALDAELEIENMLEYSTIDAFVHLTIEFGGKKIIEIEKPLFLRSGSNFITLPVEIADAKLWWPNGMGEQNLYTLKGQIAVENTVYHLPETRFGIRTVRINMDKRASGDGRLFAYEINGIKVFAKGGNWIPSDSVYARITDEKYETLIREAANANFNLLRVWGGGFYERDIFYEKCDELGIMVWQDFMFACALYPDDQNWFRTKVAREIDYQTKRLRNHPSLVMWCGNNENFTAYTSWWTGERTPDFFGGAYIYNTLAPELIHKNCPEIPYWNSSPYGGTMPHDEKTGDVHPWNYFFMSNDMDKRTTPEIFDELDASFVSEYGYVGPCAKSSTIQYHGGAPLDKEGAIWQLHNNTFEKLTVPYGINKHYTDPEKLNIDEYLLYAGLCQGMMLGYSLEAFRTKPECFGGVFWMYNDCWGEVGWTIIDYYLRRKISYYYVKRALAHVKLALRRVNGKVQITAINDTNNEVRFDFEYGYLSFDGKTRNLKSCTAEIAPCTRKVIKEYDMDLGDVKTGVYCAWPSENAFGLAPAVLRVGSFKDWKMPKANLTVSNIESDPEKNTFSFTVASDCFAHAVHFDFGDDARLSDEYFDLLPGEKKRVTVFGADACAAIQPKFVTAR